MSIIKKQKLLLSFSVTLFLIMIIFVILNGNYVFFYISQIIVISILYILNKKFVLELNISNLFTLLFVCLIVLSPVFLVLRGVEYNITYFNYISIGYLFYVLGFYIKIKEKDKIKYERKIVKNNYYIIIIIIGIISIIINFKFILDNFNYIFSGNFEQTRISVNSGKGIISIFSMILIPTIGIIYQKKLNEGMYKKTLIFFVISAIIIYFFRGSRTGIIKIVLLLILMYNTRKKIKIKNIVLILGCMLISLSCLQIFRNLLSNNASTGIIKNILDILQNASINMRYIFSFFPDKIEFQYGYTYFINILMLKPGPDLDFTLWIKEKLSLNYSGGGITPTIIGESYLNFGIIGIILIMVLLGIIISRVDKSYNFKNSFWSSYISVILIDIFRGGFANIQINLILFILLYSCEKLYIKLFYPTSIKLEKGKEDENINNKAISK